LPVCPRCGHCFGGERLSSVTSKINVAIEKAVNTRIGDEKDEAERKRLHRLFRYWLAKDIREKIGVGWREAKEEHLDDVLRVIDEWIEKYAKPQPRG